MASAVVAAALSFAVALAGCGHDSHPAASSEAPAPTISTVAAPPPQAPPPPPEVLTDVLYKLADTSIPADQKVPLIEGATAGNAEQIDKFGKALLENQYTPLGFTAENIAWSTSTPGHVAADVSVQQRKPGAGQAASPSRWSSRKRPAGGNSLAKRPTSC